jgi:hypothetical protein
VILIANKRVIKNIFKKINKSGSGGPWGYEMSRIAHFLDVWLTDGGEIVSLTRRQAFIPRKISGTLF